MLFEVKNIGSLELTHVADIDITNGYLWQIGKIVGVSFYENDTLTKLVTAWDVEAELFLLGFLTKVHNKQLTVIPDSDFVKVNNNEELWLTVTGKGEFRVNTETQCKEWYMTIPTRGIEWKATLNEKDVGFIEYRTVVVS